jgi:hypothetical protein
VPLMLQLLPPLLLLLLLLLQAYASEVTKLAPKIKHHVPLAVLFKVRLLHVTRCSNN